MRLSEKKVKENIFPIITMLLIAIVLIAIDLLPNLLAKNIDELDDKAIDISKLVINEVMVSNKGAYADENGDCYDWMELYNGTDNAIDLTDYSLSDEESGKVKWKFPSVTIEKDHYLIIYLSGRNNGGLYANFALDKTGGETLTLKKPNGKVVDSVKTIQTDKNNVMARNSNGKWLEVNEITPGYSNNTSGRKKYLENLEAKDTLKITEFLPKNKGNISFDGHFYGYIEVQNTGEETINLNNYSVSNDINAPFLYKLPDKELKPKETYIIYTSKENHDNHTNFDLESKTGKVILSKSNKIIEEVDYKDLTNGYAYIKTESNEFAQGINISPGYPNTNEGIKEFSEKERKNPKDLIISEVMTSNKEYMLHNGGQAYNWIEIYNNSNKPINLEDYYLTIDENNKKMYQLPDKEISSGAYYVIMASGDESLSTSLYKHTNFKLTSSESLYLYNKKSEIVDSMFISEIPLGYSYGRNRTNGFTYYEEPTPREQNSGNSFYEIAYKPTFKTKAGIYNNVENLKVELESIGNIYYTLDGTIPTNESIPYTGEILLDKTTVIKCISYENGKKTSEIATASYIINENHTLPVMSVSYTSEDYDNMLEKTEFRNSTINSHAELFENKQSFSIDCGFKLFGNASRSYDKKSFALKFSSKYGEPKLKYKVFDNRDTMEFDTLVLRGGSQDANYSLIRDEFITSIMDEYGTVDVQAYKPIILYLNAEYQGIYYLREKIDEDFISSHYNIPEKNTNIIAITNEVTTGTRNEYEELIDFVKNTSLENDKSYEYIKSKIDIENYIDYWIAEGYTVNSDLLNVRYFNNPEIEDGKFKMIFYDLDWSWHLYDNDFFQHAIDFHSSHNLEEGNYSFDNNLLKQLFHNEEFRKEFLKRFEWNMENVWTEEHITKKYNEIINLIEPEVKRNQERWGLTYEQWEYNCKRVEKFTEKRREIYIQKTYEFLEKMG